MRPNAVMIIPTGLGCNIGGHAGDAIPAAKLLASVCDRLILHPNVVNGSDINEMPTNALYVEGSSLDRFLLGDVCLREPRRGNHVLVVANELDPVIVNGVNAAIRTIGMSAELLKLSTPLRMRATFNDSGAATGVVGGVDELIMDVSRIQHDALAVITPIEVPPDVELSYFRDGGVNPWGGVEAKASAMIASRRHTPVAHAPFIPVGDPIQTFNEVVNPRMAAEMVSKAYLFCVMKGLHRAPLLGHLGLEVSDIDALVSPYGCWGRPHEACAKRGIPIVVVRDNQCEVFTKPCDPHIMVKNYLEAAGVLVAMGEHITLNTLTWREHGK